MKKQRKIVFWAASLLLTGALAAGGTLAYLTDKDSVTNQFVVGKVDIEGNEPSYAPDPDGKTNHIVPTQVIPKDPRIKNKGKNGCFHTNRKSDRCRYIRKPFKRRGSRRYGTVFDESAFEKMGADVQEKTEQFDGIYISLQ